MTYSAMHTDFSHPMMENSTYDKPVYNLKRGEPIYMCSSLGTVIDEIVTKHAVVNVTQTQAIIDAESDARIQAAMNDAESGSILLNKSEIPNFGSVEKY